MAETNPTRTTFEIKVTQFVKVTLDETKFDAEFMREFRENFFGINDMEGHARHLAQLHARGIAANGDFIEGYGPTDEMGIVLSTEGFDTEVVPQ